MAIFKKRSYFHHPKNFSYSAFLFSWCVNLALLGVLAKIHKEEVAAVSSYAAALTLVGLFMMLANCFLNCISTALYSSNVGADHYLNVYPIGENPGIYLPRWKTPAGSCAALRF